MSWFCHTQFVTTNPEWAGEGWRKGSVKACCSSTWLVIKPWEEPVFSNHAVYKIQNPWSCFLSQSLSLNQLDLCHRSRMDNRQWRTHTPVSKLHAVFLEKLCSCKPAMCVVLHLTLSNGRISISHQSHCFSLEQLLTQMYTWLRSKRIFYKA